MGENNNTITTKARYWTGVGYPENMRDDWEEVIGEILQIPYCYCIHDKDVDGDEDDRKTHVHILLAFPGGTTTYKNALNILQELSAPGKKAFNTCQKVNNVRFMYNYLIHDTDDSRKKHKFQYHPTERIVGNNFDIGSYEQLDTSEKNKMLLEMEKYLLEENIMNYAKFYMYVLTNLGEEYISVLRSNSGHLERLCRGNYLDWKFTHESGKLE